MVAVLSVLLGTMSYMPHLKAELSVLIGVLSLGFSVWWLTYYLDSAQDALQTIVVKSTYIESRLDSMKPMPSDVMRHIIKFLQEFDEARGGAKIWADGIINLKMRFLGGIWLKNMNEDQIKAEWNNMLRAAFVALKSKIFYRKSSIENPSNEAKARWAQSLLNVMRPEFENAYHSEKPLASQKSIAKQLLEHAQSRSDNLKKSESARWDELSKMPFEPKPLKDWIY